MPTCLNIQKSLAWCQGTPELPGIKRRLYYTSKNNIALWPTLPHDNNGRVTSAIYEGNFVLVADAYWYYIDILPEKSQLTSEAQGEVPSQTQLNKLTAVHPGIGPEATAAAAYINNNDNVYIVEDMKGRYRILGSDKWPTKSTVAQDNGQGATGTTSTTISIEATDEVPNPFYEGIIVTEDGLIGVVVPDEVINNDEAQDKPLPNPPASDSSSNKEQLPDEDSEQSSGQQANTPETTPSTGWDGEDELGGA